MTRPSSLGSVAVCALLIGCFLAPPAYALGGTKGGITQMVGSLAQRGRQAVDRLAMRSLAGAESRSARLGTTAQVHPLLKIAGMGLWAWLAGSTLKNGLVLHDGGMIVAGLFGSGVLFAYLASKLRH